MDVQYAGINTGMWYCKCEGMHTGIITVVHVGTYTDINGAAGMHISLFS